MSRAQHKSSCALQTCGQSISICHVIVLNTLSILANVWRPFFKGNIPNLFRGMYFTLAMAPFYRAGLFSLTYLSCHVETKELYAQQNTFILIERAPIISIYQFGDKRVGTFQMSIASRGEWRGMVAQKKKNPQQMSFIVSWYQMIPRATKAKLAKIKRRETSAHFFSPALLLNANTSACRTLSSKPDITAKGCHSQ